MALRADDVDLDRDAALVERFQTGDEDAFTDLYARYFTRLKRYCQGRLGDPHDAEEAAQEALVKAYRALPRFGGDRRFYPWLRVIAANVCNDRCKRKPAGAPADPDGGDVVVDAVFDAMDRAFARAALDDLNPRHREALSLWAEGHPSRHIAEELGCSTGAVDVTLHRARQSFRSRFLAIAGDGRLSVVGIAPALGRWAQRWRARLVTRAAEHSELASPLAAKLAAGAIALSVVGGAVATSRAPQQVTPTTPPPSVVHVGLTPVAVHSAASSPRASVSTTPPSTVPAHTGGVQSSPARPPSGASDIAPRLMTSDEARARGETAPVHTEVPGVVGVAVDPTPLTHIVRSKEQT